MFDIDGTLVHAGGAGRRALERSFREAFGMREVAISFSLAGLTDWAIMRRVHAENGGNPGDFEKGRQEVFARYVESLREEMGKGEGARVCPGIRELLGALSGRPDVTLALLTGNLEPGARVKLGHFGLDVFFPVGGYGSDAELREEIFGVLMARLPEGVRAQNPRITIVGDTPHDIRVAVVHGVGSIGVATGGHYTAGDLSRAGARKTLADLADTRAALAALGLSPTV